MKLKRVLLALAGVLTFSLAACSQAEGDGSGSGSGTSEGEGSGGSSQTDTGALSFMSNNKIRVDIMDDLGVTFNYGSEAVVSTKEISIVNDQTFAYNGTLDENINKINYIAYVEKDSGPTTIWQKGILAQYFLDNVLSRENFNGVKKAYIAISTGEVKWTTGLSTELDNNFNRYKNSSV
jgi:hypothetical protein